VGYKKDDQSLTILTNVYQSDDISNVKNIPKSFIDTSVNPNGILEEQPIFDPKQFSSSFTSQSNIRYRNNVQFDYLSNIKYCVKSKVIIEKESKAEESNYQRETVENMQSNKIMYTNTGTMNHTLVLNSVENDIHPTDMNKQSSKKILVKHSLRKNKSPRFLKPLKQNSHLKQCNITEIIEMPCDQTSSFICNKETLSKYRYLFADDGDDTPSMRNNFRKCHTKNMTQFEDSDFTSLQKFGTVYSTNKTNSSHLEDVKMSFNSFSKKNPFGNPQSNRDNKGN